ncbi:MAG: hypothetical protein IT457_00655 [Planctomycetes bacterium]|nr:hypothetical protein [Planctomycetota bacterium]
MDWRGIHGAPHWARVRANGLRLCERTGANPRVVELFAFLHDVCRVDDGTDPDHGRRAAELAIALAGHAFVLDDAELDDLTLACEAHSEGRQSASLTVLCCWDADRLDLGRVGVRPDPRRLCTAAARDPGLLDWAYRRSVAVWTR